MPNSMTEFQSYRDMMNLWLQNAKQELKART